MGNEGSWPGLIGGPSDCRSAFTHCPPQSSHREVAGASLIIRWGPWTSQGSWINNRNYGPGLQILCFLPASNLSSAGVLSGDQKELEARYTGCKHITALGKSAYKFKDPVVFTQEKPRMFLREEMMKGLNNGHSNFYLCVCRIGRRMQAELSLCGNTWIWSVRWSFVGVNWNWSKWYICHFPSPPDLLSQERACLFLLVSVVQVENVLSVINHRLKAGH